MELSAELFEQTIRLFKGDGSAIKNQRRTHPRVGIRCHIKIVPIEAGVPGEPVEVWTRDISRTGIGIITSQKMKTGDRFVVHFPRESEAPPLGLVCTIKCCSQLSKGIYSIGAVFEGMRLSETRTRTSWDLRRNTCPAHSRTIDAARAHTRGGINAIQEEDLKAIVVSAFRDGRMLLLECDNRSPHPRTAGLPVETRWGHEPRIDCAAEVGQRAAALHRLRALHYSASKRPAGT